MMNRQQLGNVLWGMVDTVLRDKVEDYKPYVLSLLFFKRLSDNYKWEINHRSKQFEKEHGKKPTEKQLQIIIKEAHDFIIPEGHFWEDVANSPLNKINEKLHEAVEAISEANKTILPRGVIDRAKWNAPSPDGSGKKAISPEIVQGCLNYLTPVKLDNTNVSPDILGDAYEYLIKKFADENKGGKVAGQFYTPQEIVEIIVRYLKPKVGERIYDPTCGSGGMLIRSAKYVKEKQGTNKGLHLFGQEMVWNTWAISNINMILHNLSAKIEQGDTLKTPKFKVGADIETFDMVVANFPFSYENWWGNGTPKKDKKGKPMLNKDGKPLLEYPKKDDFSDPFGRFNYGVPDFTKGDFAFIQHIIASMDSEKGRAGVVCPQGVLFRGQPEKTEEEDGQKRKADEEHLIRRKLLQGINYEGKNIIEAIVVLPKNLFYGTTIDGAIVFFNKNKPKEIENKVLMVYAGWEGWYKEESNLNNLRPHDIMRIIVQLESWGSVEKAREVIPQHETRLNSMVEENLQFRIGEIELDYQEEQEEYDKLVEELKTCIDNEKKNLEKRKEKILKELTKKDDLISEAKIKAEQEKEEIQKVKIELLDMFEDPEKRKKYFSVVDMEEIEENEFNLNIPRYVDTFEPEEEIDLQEAITEFKSEFDREKELDDELKKVLEVFRK
ncbi:MAG: N-6 DNA methylase [Nanoarchaeota archaeon]|nr:N-6 DNA methylase [Nanoarchaeota archaeon]